MGAFSRANIVNAIISATVGTALTLIFQPLVAQAQGTSTSEPGSPGPRVVAPPPPVVAPPPPVAVPPPPPVAVPSPPPLSPPPPTGNIDRGPAHRRIGYFDQDDKGSLAFEAFVLTQNFRWKYARNDQVTYPSSQVVRDVPTYLKNHLSHLLRNAQDVISIGMASCEGDRPGEEKRAETRAEQLNIWVQQARPDNRPRNYHIVNLGQYKKHDCQATNQPGEDETSDQRRIVILYVTRKVNIRDKKDLANRILRQLRAHDHLLFDPTDYSKEFVLTGERIKS